MKTVMILAAAAILAAPLSLKAQDVPPHPLLPLDPADFPAKVKAGEISLSAFRIAGCPSDGGYAAAAYAALIEAAETDPTLRGWVARDHAVRLKTGSPCPNDRPRYEALLAKWVRREWEAGLWRRPESAMMSWFLDELAHGTNPATYELLRSIARDPTVYVECASPGCHRDAFTLDLRQDAAQNMLAFRINGGIGVAEAVKAVEADLAGAPPVLDWRPAGYAGRR